MAFRVEDAAKAYERAISLGAKPVHGKVGPMELNIPAIEGIGGSLIYLVDRYGDRTHLRRRFRPDCRTRRRGRGRRADRGSII